MAELCAIARPHGALTIVDAVTSLGAHPVERRVGRRRVLQLHAERARRAVRAGADHVLARARSTSGDATVVAQSFYLDLRLLEDYWLRRKYHHTISAPLVYALQRSARVVEEEGLEARWARHRVNHRARRRRSKRSALSLLPPPAERLWSLNAVRGARRRRRGGVRRRLLDEFDIEIGAGLGPLAGRIWRVGLMGSGSTQQNVARLLDRAAGRRSNR